jgi:DNA-binding GntR family transcriptional regulator
LATAGLLQHDPHRGCFVATFDPDEMVQLYRLRAIVERAVIESIRPPRPEEIEQLTDAHKRSVDAFAVHDLATTIAADRDFFSGIYDLSDLAFLRNEARRLWDLASSYREFSTAAASTFKGSESRFRNRRTEQLRALLANDRLLLADLVVSERRRMSDHKPVLEERGLGFRTGISV